MENNRLKKHRFGRLYLLLACFVVLGVFLLEVSMGMKYENTSHDESYIPVTSVETSALEKDCLVIMDSAQSVSMDAMQEFEQIFKDMKVGYDTVDLASQIPSSFAAYETVVLTISQLDSMGDSLLSLCDWVAEGGRVLLSQTLEADNSFQTIQNKLGIQEYSYENGVVESMRISDQFMIGGASFAIQDGYDSALSVSLSKDCQVYVTTDEEYAIPLVWEKKYGDGKFVVDNFGICEKATRGFFAASYSLLQDVCIYPVIDASLFYIDDFPSPVPGGDGKYIKELYNMNVADFYANVWWPDMMEISKKYGMKFTGMIIETYEDQVSGELRVNSDVDRFNFFGDMLLNMGGELGIHGYNHQPLGLDNTEYLSEGYKEWPDMDSMKKSVTEVLRFAHDVFPDTEISTYVPPSNILSEEGRRLLVEDFPEIKNIASLYFPGLGGYDQEFEVAEDGMIETPRIVSGCNLTDYMKLAAVSELNMHYVNSHFLHPDDLLDEDRGAALGWEALKADYTKYLDWLYTSAPGIRSLTGSEGAGAVQRFYQIEINRTDKEEGIDLQLDGFYDEARFMMRVNAGTIGTVTGGSVEHITGNLYLITATADHVTLAYEK
ncbi:MAG: DUF2194 domain-containing protein [Lachnospiraceae bacterium]|nr:DUF2194 domain-containing protein [Lachnospiraceae bacterium]